MEELRIPKKTDHTSKSYNGKHAEPSENPKSVVRSDKDK
jgi:hypothetical protein